MPAFLGPVQIINVGGGVVQFGDTVNVAPKSAGKTVSGQGALNTGGFIITNNGLSANNLLDTNLIDQPLVGNS
ncbi:spore germination protein [Bacillus massilinigeriensis]|uniref:spore germination protein n=1 Tax=Bacillus mediterraneensis TaxID=1805474 RepID=UPI0008F7F5FA|nr:spore germination protein [Bacillus mediterraneensis]